MVESMKFVALVFILLAPISVTLAHKTEDAELVIDGTSTIADTDANYICATIDWWPEDKCDYNDCPWGSSSALALELSHPFLTKAVQAFDRLRIRVGGSLEDQLYYGVGNKKSPCKPFTKKSGGLFGFSEGCLSMTRWDELNRFFSETRALVTFSLNALYGRHQIRKGVWGGDWDSSNARDFINYTVSNKYHIDSWEFGNELCGKGVGASVGAVQYAKDLVKLRSMISALYQGFSPKPYVVAPGGFFDHDWFAMLLRASGPETVSAMSHHIYNLGAGVDPNLAKKILDPSYLSQVSGTFRDLKQTIQTNGPWTSAWVGESGGAYNSGGRHVSDTFINSFWYLDQLAMAAQYNTTVYCRQTLVGGNYGLLNRTTFVPNPDYYSALLWDRLMGKGVLAVGRPNVSPYLRSYAHCSKGRAGMTLLLINLSKQTHFKIKVHSSTNIELRDIDDGSKGKKSFVHSLKTSVSWVGTKLLSDGTFIREEYHLTPQDGNLQTNSVLLNGTPLELTSEGDVPSLEPVLLEATSPISIAPLSIKFVHLPDFEASACN